MSQHKIDYSQLTAGYEFEPSRFSIDAESANRYLDAVDGDRGIYEKENMIPPMSVAALAMAAMAEGLSMPPGAIHVSQNIDFLSPVKVGENLVSYARINRIVNRGRIHMMSIGIDVRNEGNTPVLAGETNFILPLS